MVPPKHLLLARPTQCKYKTMTKLWKFSAKDFSLGLRSENFEVDFWKLVTDQPPPEMSMNFGIGNARNHIHRGAQRGERATDLLLSPKQESGKYQVFCLLF